MTLTNNNQKKKKGGFTALHIASSRGTAEIVNLLLTAAADCNVKAVSGETPLHMAAAMAAYDVVKSLLECECVVNLATTGFFFFFGFFSWILFIWIDWATVLILRFVFFLLQVVTRRCILRAERTAAETLLRPCSKQARIQTMLQTVLMLPFNVFATQSSQLGRICLIFSFICFSDGSTPLHVAVDGANIETVAVLLKFSARVTMRRKGISLFFPSKTKHAYKKKKDQILIKSNKQINKQTTKKKMSTAQTAKVLLLLPNKWAIEKSLCYSRYLWPHQNGLEKKMYSLFYFF